MARSVPKTIKKTFSNYAAESPNELKELRKLKIMVVSGRTKKQKVFISIDKITVIEVRVYDLSNFSKNTYHDFNRKVKNLIQ